MTLGRSWLARDLLPSLVVALLVFHLLRTQYAERYRVTSRSMEPTLHGHPTEGDVVLVDRTAWGRLEPRPWDLVVVRSRVQGDNHLVKRLLAVGPGDVDLREGDVFFGHGNDLRRIRKHPVVHRDLRITHALYAPADGRSDLEMFQPSPGVRAATSGGLRVEACGDSLATARASLAATAQDTRRARGETHLPGYLALREAVDPSFLDGAGRLDPSGGGIPRDIGYEVDLLCGEGVDGVHLVFEHAESYFAIELGRGAGRFTTMGRVVEDFEAALPRGATTLEFGYLDGRVFLVVDGALLYERDLRLPREARLLLPDAASARLVNMLHLGAVGTEPLHVSRFRVFRDAHYAWPGGRGRPFRLEVDEVFVVGDNAHDSADSRDRLDDPFERADLVGRPVAILSPARRRWLPRYPVVPVR